MTTATTAAAGRARPAEYREPGPARALKTLEFFIDVVFFHLRQKKVRRSLFRHPLWMFPELWRAAQRKAATGYWTGKPDPMLQQIERFWRECAARSRASLSGRGAL